MTGAPTSTTLTDEVIEVLTEHAPRKNSPLSVVLFWGLWTTAQVAAYLGVSARLIQRYRAEGILTPTWETPKGHARWKIEDVERQLRELRQSRQAD